MNETQGAGGRTRWITILSTRRLSATIILLRWDFLGELCNNNASTQIRTQLFLLLLSSSQQLHRLLCSDCAHYSGRNPDRVEKRRSDRSASGGRRRQETKRRKKNCHGDKLTDLLMSGNMKYKKFITIMQAALGVAPLNKRELIPPPRKLWKPAR